MTDANGVTTTYSCDALGRRTETDYPGSEEDVSFDYNAAGQPIEMNDAVGNRTGLTYPDGKQVSYSYDPANQLTDVTDWEDRVTHYKNSDWYVTTIGPFPNQTEAEGAKITVR